jgi:CHASE2 domain-containing sensor protein
MNEKFMYGYFVVGGWQIVSMFTHSVHKCFTENKGRRNHYHKLVLLLAIVTALLIALAQLAEGFFIPALAMLYVLLFASPILAIFYTYMCYEETYIKMKRPMELLK